MITRLAQKQGFLAQKHGMWPRRITYLPYTAYSLDYPIVQLIEATDNDAPPLNHPAGLRRRLDCRRCLLVVADGSEGLRSIVTNARQHRLLACACATWPSKILRDGQRHPAVLVRHLRRLPNLRIGLRRSSSAPVLPLGQHRFRFKYRAVEPVVSTASVRASSSRPVAAPASPNLRNPRALSIRKLTCDFWRERGAVIRARRAHE